MNECRPCGNWCALCAAPLCTLAPPANAQDATALRARYDDLRGAIERNTRCFLAIEAYLGALDLPPAQQLTRRLNDWQSGVERYPRQLHEIKRDECLQLKREEVTRQKLSGG